MITPTQQKVFSFIHKRINSTGCAPSYQEIADAVDSRSTSSIHRLIVELEQRGYLTRSPGRARGITLLRVSANSAGSPSVSGAPPAPNNHSTSLPKPNDQNAARTKPAEDPHLTGELSKALLHAEIILTLFGRSDHYSMVIEDDAMKRDGILHGDTVILRRCEKASSGDVVAVAIDGKITLRRMISRGKRVALESSDPGQEIRILPAERLKIHGRMVFLMREC